MIRTIPSVLYHDLVRYSMVQFGMVWQIWQDMALHGMTRHDITWNGTVRCGAYGQVSIPRIHTVLINCIVIHQVIQRT